MGLLRPSWDLQNDRHFTSMSKSLKLIFVFSIKYGLKNFTDGGAWQVTVHGVAKSWTRLK